MQRFFTLMTILLLVALALPLSTISAQAPDSTATPGSIGDPYYPELGNSGYDVVHYDLALTVDVATNHIAGTATVSYTHLTLPTNREV